MTPWRVDDALANMVARTGTNTLLAEANGDELNLFRQGDIVDAADPTSVTTFGGWNSSATGDIHFAEARFADDYHLHRVVYHEIGHNWDEHDESGVIDGEDGFRALSGWVEDPTLGAGANFTTSGNGDWSYLNTAGFARGYGQWNPREDFATAFAHYFMTEVEGESWYATVSNPDAFADKTDLIGNWLDQI